MKRKERLLKLSNEMHGLINLIDESPTRDHPAQTNFREAPSDLLKRASDIQKKMKRKSPLAGESSCVPVTFFSMKRKKKSYVKDGPAYEVIVDRDICYKDLVTAGCEALEVSGAPVGQTLSLFTSGGAIIPEAASWSLSVYMQQQHRGPGKIRIGIGYIYVPSSPEKVQPHHDPSLETILVDDEGAGAASLDDSDGNSGGCQDESGESVKRSLKQVSGDHPAKRAKSDVSSFVRESRFPADKPEGLYMEFFPQELAEGTKNYGRSAVLGRGGYGTVYRGFIRHCDVAVKVLTKDGKAAFTKEISALGRFRHQNIVQLYGYCAKPAALVFEYMSQGSLHDKLHVGKCAELTVERRLNILKGACRGIVYLHTATPPMIHQDIKTANILLDALYQAKLGDFGFSLELPRITSGHTLFTAEFVARTEGYYPSELSAGKLSDRTDVYSFGVVVLETYSGKKAFDNKRADPKLVDCLQEDLLSEAKFTAVCDESIRPMPSVITLLYTVVTECLKRHSVRPGALQVLEILEKKK